MNAIPIVSRIMARTTNQSVAFGARLAALRKRKGLTQVQFAEQLGVSQRMITYYENEARRPPTQLLPEIARVLGVAIDELLNGSEVEIVEAPKLNKRLLRRFEKLQELPIADQKAVLRMIDSLSAKVTSSS